MTKELLQQALDALTRLSFLGNGDFPGNSEGNRIAQKAVDDIKQALSQQEQPNRWSEAVIDQLVVHHIYQAAHDTDPRKAVKDLLGISNSIALDPQVSSDAQALIDRGRREAQQEQPASVDAYNGAREDVAIWKKRALEAEELNRKFIAELNGPTYLGEPAQQDQPAQEPFRFFTDFPGRDVISLKPHGFNEAGCVLTDECIEDHWKPLYTHPAPTQPSLSDDEILNCFYASKSEGMASYMLAVGRAIEAHCRGGAK